MGGAGWTSPTLRVQTEMKRSDLQEKNKKADVQGEAGTDTTGL